MLRAAGPFLVSQVLADFRVAELTSEPCSPPEQENHQDDQHRQYCNHHRGFARNRLLGCRLDRRRHASNQYTEQAETCRGCRCGRENVSLPAALSAAPERYNCSLRNGVFISLEGIDGSGKTTQLERLRGSLEGQGYSVVVAREPGGTRLGRRIREILLDAANQDLRPIPELLLYFASRAQNIAEVITPALWTDGSETGGSVIADRFTDPSTVAYQGYGRESGRRGGASNRARCLRRTFSRT